MQDTINQIINIEQQAQNILTDAKKQKANLTGDISAELDKITTDINNRVSEKCSAVEKREKEFAESRLAKLTDEYKNIENNLNAKYAEKKDEWVNSIYNDIIGTV